MSLWSTSCPRCNTGLPNGAVFCNLCGAQIDAAAMPPRQAAFGRQPLAQPQPFAAPSSARPGFVAAGRGMAICHRCGIIAPTKRSTCARCEAPIGTSLEAVPFASDGSLWAQVRCKITCRQCGQPSAIDEPELDGTITCPQCNAMQAFDTSAWEEAFAFAHGVVDLAGPDPEGRFPTPGRPLTRANPHSSIGVQHTFGEISLSGMAIEGGVQKTRNLQLACSPGHPLCKKCGCALATQVGRDSLETRCPSCGDGATYSLDGRMPQLTPGLIGAAAEALRSDRREAHLDQTSAGMVISLKCPQCGAGLSVLQGAHSVDCTFCNTSCRVPSRTLLALKKGVSEPAPWWVLFRGPSQKRAQLERGGDDEDGGAAIDIEALVRQAQKQGKQKRNLADLLNKGGIEPAPSEEEPTSRILRWGVHIAVPLLVLALVALVGYWKILGAWAHGNTSYEVPAGITAP